MVADCAAGAAIEVEHVAAMSPRNQAAWWSPLDTYTPGNDYAYLAFNETLSAVQLAGAVLVLAAAVMLAAPTKATATVPPT